MLTTNWKFLIRASWGNRRVSSRALHGTEAYPTCVQAALGMWWSWYVRSRKVRFDHVVISSDPEGHGIRYVKETAEKAAIGHAVSKRIEMSSRLDVLQAERLSARASGDYDLADKIRAEIEAAGLVVSDQAVSDLKLIT
jgi:hypothetical protein